jgi:hypothetical protein
MYRRTVGTLIIGAIVVVSLIFAAFGRLGSTTFPRPHFKAQVGAAEPSIQTMTGPDLAIIPTTEECKKGRDAAVKWTKEQFDQLCGHMQAAN